ncbi:MAG: TonB-dependent receptor [Pseudomonadota bacterium]
MVTSVLCLSSAVALAQPSDTYDFELQAQPLVNALQTFSRITQKQVAAAGATISETTSNAVSGRFSANQALTQMVAGTGLEVVIINGSDFALRASDVGPAVEVSSNPPAIEELVVLGTKRGLSLQDTQTSVALVTADDIDEQVLLNIQDILIRTPNVGLGRNNTLNDLVIRGVTLEGFSGGTGTASVYVDGSPNSFDANQGANNLWDVSQVEILRGPQSTVQGRNALAGALIINTADPEYEWGGAARVMAGNEEQEQYSAMLTGPIIDGQVAFRLALDKREKDFDVINQITGSSTRFEEAENFRAKLLIEPDAIPELRVELIAQVADTQFGEFGSVSAPGTVDDPSFASFDPFGDETFGFTDRGEDNNVKRYTIDVRYDLNDHWTLYALATHEDIQRNTDFGTGDNTSPGEIYTFEFRAAFDYGRLSGWIGGYYFEDENSDDGSFGFPVSLLPFPTTAPDAVLNLTFSSTTKTENQAIFADLTYELDEKWSINFGARYDEEDFNNSGQQGGVTSSDPTCAVAAFVPGVGGLPCTFLLPVTAEPPNSASFDAFLPRLSVIRQLDEQQSVSFTIARGYRAGGSYLFAPAGQVPVTRSYDPEFVTNYEFAYRSQWPDQGLTFNANVYYTDWTDQQVSIPDPNNAFFGAEIVNAGESTLYGLEAELRADVSANLRGFLSLGILSAEFDNFPFAPGTGTEFENLKGNDFTNSPEVTAAVGFTYGAERGIFGGITVSYTDDSFSDLTNLDINQSDSFVLVNARVGYRWDNFEIAAIANNVFDDRYATSTRLRSVSTATGLTTPNSPASFTVNDPRLIGIELRARF